MDGFNVAAFMVCTEATHQIGKEAEFNGLQLYFGLIILIYPSVLLRFMVKT